MEQKNEPSSRPVWRSLQRGWRQTCPSCGNGALYRSYLKVNEHCPACKTELHHHRADDAPPYFVMIITAHVIVGGLVAMHRIYPLEPWLEALIWCSALVVLSLWLLPRVKGALIAYQWALRMHGFGEGAFEGADIAPAPPEQPAR